MQILPNTALKVGVYTPQDTTRLGRMLQAGRLTITLRSKRSGEHITLSLSSSTKKGAKWEHVPFHEATHVFISQGGGGMNAAKVGTYYPKKDGGVLYLNRGFATPVWLYAIQQVFLAAQTGDQDNEQREIMEANRCGKCGKELTDPVSIERGIGPTCIGSETGSVHYSKANHPEQQPEGQFRAIVDDGTEKIEVWQKPSPVEGNRPITTEVRRDESGNVKSITQSGGTSDFTCSYPECGCEHVCRVTGRDVGRSTDKKGREVPRTFAELAAACKR